MSRQIKRIVFTGDFLRPSVSALRPTQHENILWLSKLLEVPLQMATGLPCEIVHWDNNWNNNAKLDRDTVASIYNMMWQQPHIRNWPKMFYAETLPAMIEGMFLEFFRHSLVVGFELPPYLVHFLKRHEIDFVDCSLSPIRFMDDLLFEVSSSSPQITEAIRRFKTPDALIRMQAGTISSNVAKANPRPPRRNSLLVILQTSFDKVVIDQGRFATALDHFDRLIDVTKDYDHILIKEHPLEPQPQVRDKLLHTLPNAALTKDNFYRLVSHDNLKGVAALSSSCVLEGRYFGKQGHYLIPGFSHDSFSVGLEGINVGDDVIMPDFWRDVLAPTGLELTPKDGLRLPAKPNRFRQQLRSAWGYNQIDTDIPVHWANA